MFDITVYVDEYFWLNDEPEEPMFSIDQLANMHDGLQELYGVDGNVIEQGFKDGIINENEKKELSWLFDLPF